MPGEATSIVTCAGPSQTALATVRPPRSNSYRIVLLLSSFRWFAVFFGSFGGRKNPSRREGHLARVPGLFGPAAPTR